MTNVAVVLIGVLSLFNLMLTFAVIRQVRRFGEQSAGRGAGPAQQPPWHIQAGSPIPDFTTTSVSGEPVSLGDLTGARSMIGFFSSGCGPCTLQVPIFARYAKSFPGGAAQVLAVVFPSQEETPETPEIPETPPSEYVQQLAGVATVVTEPLDGPTARAFMVTGYPTYYVLDERGQVEISGHSMSRIAAAVSA
jgi:thiol-disulfide isomerase/thioredoxin